MLVHNYTSKYISNRLSTSMSQCKSSFLLQFSLSEFNILIQFYYFYSLLFFSTLNVLLFSYLGFFIYILEIPLIVLLFRF